MECPFKNTIRALRLRHRSYWTEKAYLAWLVRFKEFVKTKHPQELTGEDVQDFLTHLAVEKKISASTQNQIVLNAFSLYSGIYLKRILQAILMLSGQGKRGVFLWCLQKESQTGFDKMS